MPRITKRPRPGTAHASGDRLKLHLREVEINRTRYRVVTLRPGTDAAFSTNFFHETWHVLTDPAGGSLFARLLWGLAFQRAPGTLILIHGAPLRPTPFEAEPSFPVALLPSDLTPFRPDDLRELRQRLPRLGPPTRTIRWSTPGFVEAIGDQDAFFRSEEQFRLFKEQREGRWRRERMSNIGGLICYSAPGIILRRQAVNVERIAGCRYEEMNYEYLAQDPGGWADGEVQVFRGYRRQLSLAIAARRDVLAALREPLPPETLRMRIWDRKLKLEQRRKRVRKQAGIRPPSPRLQP